MQEKTNDDRKIEYKNPIEIFIRQTHLELGYVSYLQTFIYLKERYMWKGISSIITEYCKTYSTCQKSNFSIQKPQGELYLLPISNKY